MTTGPLGAVVVAAFVAAFGLAGAFVAAAFLVVALYALG